MDKKATLATNIKKVTRSIKKFWTNTNILGKDNKKYTTITSLNRDNRIITDLD